MIDQPLSEAGERRRSQILELAKREARHRRQLRNVSRTSVGLLTISAAAMAVFLLRTKQTVQPQPQPIVAITPATQPSVAIQELQTDTSIADRLTITPQPPCWIVISDRELLDELARAGQPAGIVSMNGKTILLPRDSVTLR